MFIETEQLENKHFYQKQDFQRSKFSKLDTKQQINNFITKKQGYKQSKFSKLDPYCREGKILNN